MADRRIEGLALKVGPLGEHDRLLTLLSDQVGVIRLAVPGARKPKSSLAGAVPLTLLELQVVGRAAFPGFDSCGFSTTLAPSVNGWRRWLEPRPWPNCAWLWWRATIRSTGCGMLS